MIMQHLGKLGAMIRKWDARWFDNRGVAMVEFAFIAPVVLFMGVVGIELANMAVVNMRISQAAMHIGDNASRIGDRSALATMTVYESDINDILIGVRIQAGVPIDLYENGRVILSSLERNSDDGQKIGWQRCMGLKNVASSYGTEGTGNTGTAFAGMGASGSELKAATTSDAIMFVEIEYDYQPLFDNQWTQPFLPTPAIRSEAAFHVRGNRDLSGVAQRDPSSPDPSATCNKFEKI
ncbi:TadE/TadG family type IV pilus assembly protein [Parerythrobacter jejuensis]|uniref:TadE-like domain-containing protein n=1 Tax=Parerythrobacter jejuensis TaxID=795812 RepID=A0A845AT38_9SPHN|nr:TadE/TadG family type IV pilus assembly protein [Parerythrobacter jejuensis]MXP32764.1 hypothetical protein [Parerythrobacter jejuensis]